MLVLNYSTVRENFKKYCDEVTENKKTVIVTRKNDNNVVMISLDKWNQLTEIINTKCIKKCHCKLACCNI